MSIVCLLIDDDEDDREIFSIALKEANPDAECIAWENGVEALNRLNNGLSFKPDYIFLDLNMPRMDGRQCLIEIKKMPWLSSAPLIIYSTSSHPRDIKESLKLGANHFLIKPSSIASLTHLLSEFFKTNKFPAHYADIDRNSY